MSKAVLFFADGTEECEALLVADLLRRARVEVIIASAMGRRALVSSHGIHLNADALAEDVDYSDVDMVILPGGIPGTPNLAENKTVTDTCVSFARAGKKVAAICAAPSILASLGLLEGRNATAHAGFQDKLAGAIVHDEEVVVVIPVENENVDPVVGCRVDLTGHLRRVFFVGISPGRHFGLLLAVETGTGFLDQFPFGPAVALEAVVTSVVGVVIREIVAGYRDPVGVFRLFRRGAAGCECNSQRGAGDRGKDFHFESVLDRVIFVD